MHKGRIYPYHPTFWVGQVFFWRGFLPWKMRFLRSTIGSPGFPVLDTAPFPLTSQPGVISSAHEIYWTWPVTWTSVADEMRMTIKDQRYSGVLYAEWHFQILLFGAELDGVYSYQTYPQAQVQNFLGGWSQTPGFPPSGPHALLNFRYATYAEGGSPWS